MGIVLLVRMLQERRKHINEKNTNNLGPHERNPAVPDYVAFWPDSIAIVASIPQGIGISDGELRIALMESALRWHLFLGSEDSASIEPVIDSPGH